MVSSYPVSQFFADSLTSHDANVLIHLHTITMSRKRITSVLDRRHKNVKQRPRLVRWKVNGKKRKLGKWQSRPRRKRSEPRET